MQKETLIEHLGFGCVSLTTLPFAGDAIRLLETAYGTGIRLFDTAPLYGNGYSEAIVGKFLRGKRKDIVLTTKFGLNSNRKVSIPVALALPINYLKKKAKSNNNFSTNRSAILPSSNSLIPFKKIDKKEIENSFKKSIEVLRTDYIDNFLLHEAMPSFLTEEALHFLLCLKKEGKVLKIGVASGYINLVDCNDFNEWDILQYENGTSFDSDLLVKQFLGKHHIYHSVLKGIKNMRSNDFGPFELAAVLLLYAIKKNPGGKVLFATTKSKTITKNIEAMEKFKDLSIKEIKSFVDALY